MSTFIINFFWDEIFLPRDYKKSFIRNFQKKIFSPLAIFLIKIGFKPMTLTLLNIFFGALSAIFLILKNNVLFLVFFVLAILMDSLDGLVARLTNNYSSSKFNIDIFADILVRIFIFVSFFMLYKFQFLLYGILCTIFSVIIYFIKREKLKTKFVAWHFEHLIFIALIEPYTSLLTISIFLYINLISILVSFLKF